MLQMQNDRGLSLEEAKTSVAAMLDRDESTQPSKVVVAFSKVDLNWAMGKIVRIADILETQGYRDAVDDLIQPLNPQEKLSEQQKSMLHDGLTMLGRVADMPAAGDDKAFKLLAADMCLHRSASLGCAKSESLFKESRETITQQTDDVYQPVRTAHRRRRPSGVTSGSQLSID
jgi:hypothetical protein